eukprot:Platyproteum_vivax@DN10509_c0_g1_i1.p1
MRGKNNKLINFYVDDEQGYKTTFRTLYEDKMRMTAVLPNDNNGPDDPLSTHLFLPPSHVSMSTNSTVESPVASPVEHQKITSLSSPVSPPDLNTCSANIGDGMDESERGMNRLFHLARAGDTVLWADEYAAFKGMVSPSAPGAVLNQLDSEGYSQLMRAAQFGHTPMCHLLLSLGADALLVSQPDRVTAFELACDYRRYQAAIALLEAARYSSELLKKTHAKGDKQIKAILQQHMKAKCKCVVC